MAAGEEGLKRARTDESEQAVRDAKSPEQVHAAKKLRLEDKVAMDASEKACRRTAGVDNEGEAEDICRDKESECGEEGENPLELKKEGDVNRESNEKSNDDDSQHIRADCHMHVDVAGDVAQLACAGKASNKAARAHGDHTSEDRVTFAGMGKVSKEATVGPRCFTSSKDMLEFFYQLLHCWPLNLDINRYEHMMLEDLLKKGHQEAREKVGVGIKAFQVRMNKEFNTRCYYVIRKDGSMKDFSYRKCVDNILSLPKNLKPHFNVNTSNQNQKGFKPQHNNKGPKAQHSHTGSKPQLNTKSRSKLSGDTGGDRGISGLKQGRGICVRQGRDNRGGNGRGNCGGQGRDNHGRIGRGDRGGQGRGNHGGLGSGNRGGAGCRF